MEEALVQVQSNDLSDRALTFYIGESIFGIGLDHVLEIIKVEPSTHVPNVPAYIKGVINLRGKIVPLIDVRLKFNREEIPYNEKTCIIVVTIHDMQVGLIVDSVAEVVTVPPDQLAEPPEIGTGHADHYLLGVAEVGQRVILIIDCEKFFQSDLTGSIY